MRFPTQNSFFNFCVLTSIFWSYHVKYSLLLVCGGKIHTEFEFNCLKGFFSCRITFETNLQSWKKSMKNLDHPPPKSKMEKWRVFALRAASSLIWGGWGFSVPFYFVQDCRIQKLEQRLFSGGLDTVSNEHLHFNLF